MCLAVPMKILEVTPPLALVDVSGIRRQVNIELIEAPEPGEYVIVHAGYAIEKVSEQEALETLDLIRQVASFGEEPPAPTTTSSDEGSP